MKKFMHVTMSHGPCVASVIDNQVHIIMHCV